MAYTSGIFYIDPVSGSDTARTALTSCTASNPSGSITRINKTGHGLVTGAVVDLTLFTAWLNDAWKITVVDADNFDLDGATWQATADTSGTVTPRGGSSWADAWQTTASGATAARIQPGDSFRWPKTPVVGTGVDATFTAGSKTVTLSSALTKTITNAATGWTAAPANITLSTSTNRKIGSNALLVTPAPGFTTGKVCYIGLGSTQDFSGYQKISFWFRPNTNGVIAADTYKICLCSDTIGNTIVNEINIPATLSSNTYYAYTLDYGAALGSSIQSVAIYANSDPGTLAFTISNIFAANDFHLQSAFGWENDCWYAPQSINGTTVVIDSVSTAVGGRGWRGTNGTAELFIAQPYITLTTSTANAISEDADAWDPSTYSGGWNTSSGLQDGYTHFRSQISGISNCFGTSRSNIVLERFAISAYATALSFPSGGNVEVNECVFACLGVAFSPPEGHRFAVSNCKFLANSTTQTILAGTTVVSSVFYSCNQYGVSMDYGRVTDCVFANNASGSVQVPSTSLDIYRNQSGTFLRGCSFLDTTEVAFASAVTVGIMWSKDHDQTVGDDRGFARAGLITKQSTTVHDTEPVAWKVEHTNSEGNAANPIVFKIGERAVSASSLVTFTAWVKKDHATNVGCSIFVEDEVYNISGVVADAATAADNTSWQQLTITFTPTVSGIVPIYFKSWYIAGNSNTYVGTTTCTQ